MLPHIEYWTADINDYEEKYGILIFDGATCILHSNLYLDSDLWGVYGNQGTYGI